MKTKKTKAKIKKASQKMRQRKGKTNAQNRKVQTRTNSKKKITKQRAKGSTFPCYCDSTIFLCFFGMWINIFVSKTPFWEWGTRKHQFFVTMCFLQVPFFSLHFSPLFQTSCFRMLSGDHNLSDCDQIFPGVWSLPPTASPHPGFALNRVSVATSFGDMAKARLWRVINQLAGCRINACWLMLIPVYIVSSEVWYHGWK